MPGGSSTQKFDELIIQAGFKIFVVFEFEDESVYPLGSTEWDIDGAIGTELNGSGPDKRDITVEKSDINWSGSFKKGDEKPEKMIPPNAIDALQPVAK